MESGLCGVCMIPPRPTSPPIGFDQRSRRPGYDYRGVTLPGPTAGLTGYDKQGKALPAGYTKKDKRGQ